MPERIRTAPQVVSSWKNEPTILAVAARPAFSETPRAFRRFLLARDDLRFLSVLLRDSLVLVRRQAGASPAVTLSPHHLVRRPFRNRIGRLPELRLKPSPFSRHGLQPLNGWSIRLSQSVQLRVARFVLPLPYFTVPACHRCNGGDALFRRKTVHQIPLEARGAQSMFLRTLRQLVTTSTRCQIRGWLGKDQQMNTARAPFAEWTPNFPKVVA